LRQIVGTHQPDKTRAREVSLQLRDGIHRIICAKPRFEIEHLDAGMPGEASRDVDTPLEGGHAARRLQRVLRRHQPPDRVEIEALQRFEADVTVAFMGGVEGAAEQADAARGEFAEREALWRQGRTCPLPRTTYL
jgi:hypothetical protein